MDTGIKKNVSHRLNELKIKSNWQLDVDGPFADDYF